MTTLIFLAIVLFIILLLLALFPRSKFPALPGPSWPQYLPNGLAFPMYLDSSKMLTVIRNLSTRYGNVFQLWIGPLDTVVTSVPADIAQILSASLYFERPKPMHQMFEAAVPRGLMGMNRAMHQKTRKHLRHHFNFSHLKAFHSSMNDAVEELEQSLLQLENQTLDAQPSPVLNLSELFTIAAVRIITNTAFGWNMSKEERLRFAKGTDLLVDQMMLDFVGYPFRQMLTRFGSRNTLFSSRDEVNTICQRFIKIRLEETDAQKASRPPDLLDAIMSLDDSDLASITSQTLIFAVAGAHTTIETLAWSIYETCCNPQVMVEIEKEIATLFGHYDKSHRLSHEDVQKLSYLKQVWNETLRKHPPGPMFIRVALQDVRLSGSGVHIPAGANVVALAHGSQMDESVWTEPERFMPERWDAEHGEAKRVPAGSYVPYSLGPRNCAGRFLAEYEGVLILAELHRRFEFTLACKPEDVTTCFGWVEHERSSRKDGAVGAGLPVRVRSRPNK